MHTRPRRAPTALLLVLVLAGCGLGGDSAGTAGPSVPSAGAREPVLLIVEDDGDPPGVADGPGLTVAQAIEHQPTDDIVLVTGALFVDPDGTVRLCDAVLESFPPQCGGASVRVENLDLGAIALEDANGVRWAEGVTLLGSVE